MILRIAEGDRQPLLVTKIPPTTCHEAALHTMPLTPPTRQPSAHQEIVVRPSKIACHSLKQSATAALYSWPVMPPQDSLPRPPCEGLPSLRLPREKRYVKLTFNF